MTWCTGTKDLLYAAGFLLTLHGAVGRDRVPPWLLLVGLAAFVPAALRLRLPGARLVYWHVLLAACLLGGPLTFPPVFGS